ASAGAIPFIRWTSCAAEWSDLRQLDLAGLRLIGGFAPETAGQVPILDRTNAIAQLRRLFELELFRSFAHLRFELLQQLGNLLVGLGSGHGGVQFAGVQRNGDVVRFDDVRELHVYALYDRLWRDVIFRVVGQLLFTTAIGFRNGLVHGARSRIGIQHGAAFDVAGAAAGGLGPLGGAAQVALPVGLPA